MATQLEFTVRHFDQKPKQRILIEPASFEDPDPSDFARRTRIKS